MCPFHSLPDHLLHIPRPCSAPGVCFCPWLVPGVLLGPGPVGRFSLIDTPRAISEPAFLRAWDHEGDIPVGGLVLVPGLSVSHL